jgi:hypothetical protein
MHTYLIHTCIHTLYTHAYIPYTHMHTTKCTHAYIPYPHSRPSETAFLSRWQLRITHTKRSYMSIRMSNELHIYSKFLYTNANMCPACTCVSNIYLCMQLRTFSLVNFKANSLIRRPAYTATTQASCVGYACMEMAHETHTNYTQRYVFNSITQSRMWNKDVYCSSQTCCSVSVCLVASMVKQHRLMNSLQPQSKAFRTYVHKRLTLAAIANV